MRLLALGLIVGVLASVLVAQDSHYWTHQYGPKSALAGGAVIAGAEDTSAGYYNPARLAWITNESLSASATLYQVDFLSVENGAGTGSDLTSTQARLVPLLASGILLIKGAPKDAFGFNIISRQLWSVVATARRRDVIDVIPEARSAGDEEYVGQLRFRASLSEFWAGLSWAHKFDDRFSFGITHYGALRLQDQDFSLTTRAVSSTTAVFGADNLAEVSYYNLRMLWKLGFSADLGDFKLGATLTTASLNLFGSGSVGRNVTVDELDTDDDGTAISFVADDRQENLQTTYRSPWSFGLGAEYGFASGTRLSGSFEWFLPVGRYSVMAPQKRNFIIGIPVELNSREQLRVDDTKKGAFNFALAVEQKFTEGVRGVWSLRSDFSTRIKPKGVALELGIASWNLFHIATGVVIRSAKNEFSIGIQLSLGAGKFDQATNFGNPQERNLLAGPPGRVEQGYTSFAVIAGYTFFI